MDHDLSTGPAHRPDDPLDDVDVAVLGRIGHLVATLDPVPDGLVERSLFAVTLAALEAEVMELSYVGTPAMSVRGDAPPVEARTITFTHDTLTVMVSLSLDETGLVRVDGWLAPAAALQVELHRPDGMRSTTSDEDGRFVLEGVRRGPASLVVRRPDGAAVSTPVVEL